MKWLLYIAFLAGLVTAQAGDWIWWEAESARRHNFPPSQAFAPNPEEARLLSGSQWLQTDLGGNKGAYWEIEASRAGKYEIWGRKFWKHGPFRWRVNQQAWQHCGRDCALADTVELRQHVVANWVYLGSANLVKGRNRFEIKIAPDADAVAFDCFIATQRPFQPSGKLKPGEAFKTQDTPTAWSVFDPPRDRFSPQAGFDLRSLNQDRAGREGFVIRLGKQLGFSRSRRPVRFWGVNLELEFDQPSQADHLARHLAKRGVNLVRLHTPLAPESLDGSPRIKAKTLKRIHYWVHCLAREGIYTEISFYFPLWFRSPEGQRPFARLFYHPDYQQHYRHWLRELLTQPNPHSGLSLAEDPALAMIELCNEDNLFFWTFKPHENPSSSEMAPLEQAFGDWVKAKYGSIQSGVSRWGRPFAPVKGDDFPAGRIGLYPAGRLSDQAWAKAGRNAHRAADQARFLHDTQAAFHRSTIRFLRDELAVKCCIVAGNWITAEDRTLAAIDKHSQFAADLLDRHFYNGGLHEGPDSGFALRRGHRYQDRSVLFSPAQFPTHEIHYQGMPSMVSEFGQPAPNRFRAESPFLACAYGSLLDTDAFIHFAHPGQSWQSSPSKFGLALPSLLGQFPACAFAYREGLIQSAPPVYSVVESMENLFDLDGSPVTQAAPSPAKDPGREQSFDPFATLVGPVEVQLSPGRRSRPVHRMRPGLIDRKNQRITSLTGELNLDYQQGLLVLRAPAAQGFCGFPGKDTLSTPHLRLRTNNEYLSLMAVALDKKALNESQKILVQVVTEEQASGYQSRREGQTLRIQKIGHPPLLTRDISAILQVRHKQASKLQATPLDINGMPLKALTPIEHSKSHLTLKLLPNCFYYLITPAQQGGQRP